MPFNKTCSLSPVESCDLKSPNELIDQIEDLVGQGRYFEARAKAQLKTGSLQSRRGAGGATVITGDEKRERKPRYRKPQ